MSTEEILNAFKTVTAADSTTDSVWLKDYTKPEADDHQFLFFFKPEATGGNIKECMDIALKVLTDNGVSFGAIRVVGGPYLDRHDIMVQHYGVISQIYKQGFSAISEQAKEKLNSDFSKLVAEAGTPIGGYEFIQKNPEFTPLTLQTLSDNVGCKRLAGGTYLLSFKHQGVPQLVLNPFHGYQLVPFTSKGRALIVFEGRSKKPWAELRTSLCGATDPAGAEAGSIRNEFLKHQDKVGFNVDRGTNGVHMSAGPLEGMVELQRFLSDHDAKNIRKFTDLGFGAALLAAGVTEEQIEKLASNIDVSHEGASISTFDLTEEKDASVSVALLKSVL